MKYVFETITLTDNVLMIVFQFNFSFDSLDGPKSQANKAGINLMIFILIFVKHCLYWGAILDF